MKNSQRDRDLGQGGKSRWGRDAGRRGTHRAAGGTRGPGPQEAATPGPRGTRLGDEPEQPSPGDSGPPEVSVGGTGSMKTLQQTTRVR